MSKHNDIGVELVEAVVALAQQAGAMIMQIYATQFAVDIKADASPVTLADHEAHRFIVQGLQRLTPHTPILSEESEATQHAFSVRQHWPELWLVDPLDGTREFVQRSDEFTVNIALIRHHQPVLGVVQVPVTQQVFFGGQGLGAQCMQGETRRTIQTRIPASQPPTVVGSRSHSHGSLQQWLERLGPHQYCGVGSALKFCCVAEGSADFYPRFGATSEWDTAAGQAVLESAGGVVLDMNGSPLRYNARDTLLNPHFIAMGDPHSVWPTECPPTC